MTINTDDNKIPIHLQQNPFTNMLTLPQEVYLRMYESDFCCDLHQIEDYWVVNLGKREDDEESTNVIFTIFILKPDTDPSKTSIFSCNLIEEKGQFVVRGEEAVRMTCVQRYGFKEYVENSTDEKVVLKMKEKLNQANNKILEYLKYKEMR
ncbi:Conserved_hypothetical protein [Hexamita inflata]|uniref:Uncharacterized protein n=1 Tax=Hexamita inflata TaxID=28002 RepID=A0AA86N858_9EUKA|nr:Conserved hypothetical protein [Hexamita inflata]CAI9952177.1 Conserved hypothetical protein [Hexamita inflata]